MLFLQETVALREEGAGLGALQRLERMHWLC